MDRHDLIDQGILILDQLRRLEPLPAEPSPHVVWHQRALKAEAQLVESRRQVAALTQQLRVMQASRQRTANEAQAIINEYADTIAELRAQLKG